MMRLASLLTPASAGHVPEAEPPTSLIITLSDTIAKYTSLVELKRRTEEEYTRRVAALDNEMQTLQRLMTTYWRDEISELMELDAVASDMLRVATGRVEGLDHPTVLSVLIAAWRTRRQRQIGAERVARIDLVGEGASTACIGESVCAEGQYDSDRVSVPNEGTAALYPAQELIASDGEETASQTSSCAEDPETRPATAQ